MFAVVGTAPAWLTLAAPLGAVLIGALGVYAAFHPHFKEREAREEAIKFHAERLENAADLMFGSEGDPKRGKLPVRGLAARMDELEALLKLIKRAIGINGHEPARPIMEMLDQAETAQATLRRDVDAIKRQLHLEGSDDRHA